MTANAFSTLTLETAKDAERQLQKADKTMRRLIATHGPCPLSKRRGPAFHTLAWSIIGQQLSSKAAAAIVQRVRDIAPTPFKPEDFILTTPERLRAVGLSTRKAECIIGLAERVVAGSLSFGSLRRKDDEDVIAILTEISGIGRWTAEMFLIFGLGRPDVLSLGDAGLQRAAVMLYGDRANLEEQGETWAPWRTIASWYLWRHLDG
jgi:DNA-3-methyladenine glycosylase II